MILALCIGCSWMGYGSITSLASTETINAAKMEGATYHWSGTWENEGVDSNPAGDAGSKCFDGDTNTKWGSANKANGDQWLSVVFPSVIQISGFKVWQESSYTWTDITGFKVQIQNGTDTWTDVYSFDRTDDVSWATKENTFTTPLSASALRVYVTAAQIGSKSAAELTELEVYSAVDTGNGTGNTNKAFKLDTVSAVSTVGATASASSSSTEVPSRSIDGNMDSKWGSQDASTPQWLQITFPNAVDMAGYVLNQDFNWSDVTAYKVEVLVSSGEWETVKTHSGSSIGLKQEILFDTLWNTDTIRFTFTEVGDNCARGASPQATTSIDFKEITINTAVEKVSVGKGTGNTNKTFNTKAALSTEGAIATASSSTTEVPSRAIDGKLDSKWGSLGASTPQWLQITFPNTVDMAGYVLNQDFNWSDVIAYNVEVAVNGDWVTVYTYSAGTSIGAQQEILFNTLWNTDTIRFTFTEVGNNAIIGDNGAATSIDFTEVMIYTSNLGAGNPVTSDDTFVLTGALLTIVAAAVILKRGKYAF